MQRNPRHQHPANIMPHRSSHDPYISIENQDIQQQPSISNPYVQEPRYMTPISITSQSSPPSNKAINKARHLEPVTEERLPATTAPPTPQLIQNHRPLTYGSSPDTNSSANSSPPRHYLESPTPNYHQKTQTLNNNLSSPLKRLSLHDNMDIHPTPDMTT